MSGIRLVFPVVLLSSFFLLSGQEEKSENLIARKNLFDLSDVHDISTREEIDSLLCMLRGQNDQHSTYYEKVDASTKLANTYFNCKNSSKTKPTNNNQMLEPAKQKCPRVNRFCSKMFNCCMDKFVEWLFSEKKK
jgi:hypothetical protein